MIKNPIKFKPNYMQRVWGGRMLEEVLKRELPDDKPYGESWEISAREDFDSIVDGGYFDGMTLNQLWNNDETRNKIFGENNKKSTRFPLLFKILDCKSDLSIQVHPSKKAVDLYGGEQKSEFWYVASANENANIFAGFNRDIDEEEFKKLIENNKVAECLNLLPTKKGDFIYLPSGRIHAICGGNLIFEIQQNSDTTYRVYDWNRIGLDGSKRELHIKESLDSIDFNDKEISMSEQNGSYLVNCEHFKIKKISISKDSNLKCNQISDGFFVVIVLSENIDIGEMSYYFGDFLLVPNKEFRSFDMISTDENDVEFLVVEF